MSRRLLLVGWDTADWRPLGPLMQSGQMPALQHLVNEGASGSMLCGQPLIGAAQWTSMVTGKRAWQHRVCHQAALDPGTGRLVPASAAQRQAAALWEILQAKQKSSVVIGWPATHGSRGAQLIMVSNRYSEATAPPGVRPWPPAAPGSYCPEELGATLDPLRISPEAVDAELISRFVPGWKGIDQKRDRRLSYLRLFLAADLSHHAAAIQLLRGRWDFAAIHYPALGAITPMFLPFVPPRPSWVAEEEFQLYQQVLPLAYVMLDRLLQGLLQIVGNETAVVVTSAYGVTPHSPPRTLRAGDTESWRSPYGVLALSGPSFKSNSQVLGATILDAAPTILTWFGLPIGDDMEGRVLMESFASFPEVTRVASWEPRGEKKNEDIPLSAGKSSDKPDPARLRLEYDWNFARSALEATRFEEALPWLERLFRSFPERAEFGLALFQCQLSLKQIEPAAQTLEVLMEALPPGTEPLLCRAELLIAQCKRKEACLVIEEIQKLKPAEPAALRRLGMLLWRLRQWAALAKLAEAVLKLDPNEPLAWLAQAEASLRQGRSSAALTAAQRAISLNYFLPQAHLILSRALVNQGKWAEAREAMRVVLQLQPGNKVAAAYSRRSGMGNRR